MAPVLAERLGSKRTLAIYFLGMSAFIWLSFGWVFYLENGLTTFIGCSFFLEFFGGNFGLFSLWLPEQYETSVRAAACICNFFWKVHRSGRQFHDWCHGLRPGNDR
jgi:hypothetical protein